MTLNDIYPLIATLNGELHTDEEVIGEVATKDRYQRMVDWAHLLQDYGERVITKILPVSYMRLQVTVSRQDAPQAH